MDIDIIKLAQINNALWWLTCGYCKFRCRTLLFTPWSFVVELVEQHENNRNTPKKWNKMNSKATKKIITSRYKEGRRENVKEKKKKGRKKGENNLTYLTLLELQDTPSPLSSTSLNEAPPSWAWSLTTMVATRKKGFELKFHNNDSNKKERVWAQVSQQW